MLPSRKQLCLLCFLIPLVFMITFCVIAGIEPFGTNSLMVHDGYQQYTPLLSLYAEKMRSGDSLFYSWAGLGSNFWAIFGYYLASPLNLLILWADVSEMWMAASWLVVLKISLCGLTAGIYFTHKYESIWTVPAACGYALSGYVLLYGYNIMWLDVLFIFPIILLGMDRMFDGKSNTVYVLSLFYAMWCNYYMALIVCLFLIFWFLCREFKSIKQFVRHGCLFAGSSILAACMAAVILIPSYLALSEAAGYDNVNAWVVSIADVLSSLTGGAYGTTLKQGVNLYCGVFAVIGFPVYFSLSEIPKSVRIRRACLVLFLIAGCCLYPLNFFWNGLHATRMLPNRHAFLIIFLCLDCFLDVMRYRSGIKMGTWFIAATVFIISAILGISGASSRVLFVVVLMLCILYACMFAVMQEKRWIQMLLCVCTVLELCGIGMFRIIQCGIFITTKNTAPYEPVSDDDGFYRSDIDSNVNTDYPINYGVSLGLNTVSLFSSTISDELTKFYDKIGEYASTSMNLYDGVTPVTDLLYNVRYVYNSDGNVLERVTSGSVGYPADESLADLELTGKNPFENYNLLCEAGWDVTPFIEIPVNEVGKASQSDSEYRYEFSDEAAFTYLVPENADTVYVYVFMSQAEAVIYVNGEKYADQEDCYITGVSGVSEGDEICVVLTAEKDAENMLNCVIAAAVMDPDMYALLESELLSTGMQVTDVSNGSLSGTVTVSENQSLFLSVPYDIGWTVYVDGEETEYESLCDAFLIIPMSAGTHEIEMHYIPPGFYAGLIITILSVLLFLITCFFKRRCYRVKSLVCILEPADYKKDVSLSGHPDACNPGCGPAA